MWAQPCAHVIFDTDPTPRGRSGPAEEEEMSQAMIRGMVDASGDQFVAYFLPTTETIRKRKRDRETEMDYTEEEEYEYKMAREYNWNVKNKATKGYEENYFFVFREGEGVFYDELVTRVHLSKRRARGGAGGVQSAVSQLVVKHRELNDNERKAQRMRMTQLDTAPTEEEEEEEFEEEEGDEEAEGGEGADDAENGEAGGGEEDEEEDEGQNQENDDGDDDDAEAEQESNDDKDEKESSGEEGSSAEESASEESEEEG